MNAQTSRSRFRISLRRRLAGGALLAGGTLAAFAASAGTGELAGQTVHGILGFFADPENVRGVFGAAAGALASVIAARPLNRGGSGPGSDDL